MGIPGIPSPAVAYGSLVVVTGCTGFIGSHVVDQALAAGYDVRGTTRDVASNRWMDRHFGDKYGAGRFSLVAVEDMEAEGAFRNAVQGASGFIHVAHDVRGSRDPSVALPRSINGAVNALSAAVEAGIKRFVYTSSSFAVTQPKPDVEFTVTEETFNDNAVALAEKGEADGATVYSASKVVAERALRQWVKEHGADVVVNCLCPNANIGPMISAADQGHPSSAAWVAALARHEYDSLLGTAPQHFINVQDDAKLHIIALAHPDVINKRIFAMTGPLNLQDIVESLRRVYSERRWDDFPEGGRDRSTVEPIPRVEALLREAYGSGFIGLDESVQGNAKDILG